MREERPNAGGSANSGSSQPGSQYGAPQPQYGPPQVGSRVVGIVLENTVPAIQVAQYRAQSSEPSSFANAQVSAPSSNYGAPF